ncbi:NACHT domain-containing NTPase [Oscillatoria sp. FACHB-1406]|uniref:NACHT domain-containing protein n=1 Tax=Oscillatoria sp. FACHB-1406 TaxID=2692846 RepID=UPI00168684DE|nr:NACHT domain-containing NTPase [Oscillatoria sp. FACHB-1406]MBD2578139.1 NACHT domain-containing NTPase [Oscillatoria sp. FACHB-1406]
MTGRSLVASEEGIKKAERALERQRISKTVLAESLLISRSTVTNFFARKPIVRNNLIKICDWLELDWQEIIEKPSHDETEEETDVIVREVRAAISEQIRERCGKMRILDMTHPIGLNEIYTDVNILEKITASRRKNINELLENFNFDDDFNRWGLSQVKEKRVPALTAVKDYPHLLILGKPGAGKTTFLKFLAIHCLDGKFCQECVPFFVTLKDFAEAQNSPNLLDYIATRFQSAVTPERLKNILKANFTLVLLDGLDEVREEDSSRVLKEIDNFCYDYPNNRVILTCRIAAKEYIFEKFTEVEIADFDDEQIATFANNWFKDKQVRSEKFLERLNGQEAVKKLATDPLLLTLLCLVFEESGDFSENRANLYKEGVDALLKKWDAERGIKRNNPYKKLSLGRKEDLLSQLAWTTFVESDYFFKQERAEREIVEYIRNLPGAADDEEALQLDSEKVLRSIEAQHGLLVERAKGIYSFSHLTFHEYFAAREIVTVQQSALEKLQELTVHLTEPRWQEVFLLAAAMSPKADRLLLLMKERADAMVAGDEKIQEWLTWGMEKARSVKVSYTPEMVEKVSNLLKFKIENDLSRTRSFYIYTYLYQYLFTPLGISSFLPYPRSFSAMNYSLVYIYLEPSLSLDSNLLRLLSRSIYLSGRFHEKSIFHATYPGFNQHLRNVHSEIISDLYHCLHLSKSGKILHEKLKQLNEQLPDERKTISSDWWIENSQNWNINLRRVMIQHRNIGHNWKFSDEQRALLMDYWEANKLLMQCLNSECDVSKETRQKIEETLFLAIAFCKDNP